MRDYHRVSNKEKEESKMLLIISLIALGIIFAAIAAVIIVLWLIVKALSFIGWYLI